MKIKLFDNITVTAEPEEVYMLLWIHNKMSKPAPAHVIAPETPESAAPAVIETPESTTMSPMGAKVTKPEKPKPAKKTDKVDWPKAKALRDAGWSYDKIGDELGISGVTVSAHLKEMEK